MFGGGVRAHREAAAGALGRKCRPTPLLPFSEERLATSRTGHRYNSRLTNQHGKHPNGHGNKELENLESHSRGSDWPNNGGKKNKNGPGPHGDAHFNAEPVESLPLLRVVTHRATSRIG